MTAAGPAPGPFARRAARREGRRGTEGDPSAPPAVSRPRAWRAGPLPGPGGVGAAVAAAGETPHPLRPASPGGTTLSSPLRVWGRFPHPSPTRFCLSLYRFARSSAGPTLSRQNFFVDSNLAKNTPPGDG